MPDFTGENELIRIFGCEFFCAAAAVAISWLPALKKTAGGLVFSPSNLVSLTRLTESACGWRGSGPLLRTAFSGGGVGHARPRPPPGSHGRGAAPTRLLHAHARPLHGMGRPEQLRRHERHRVRTSAAAGAPSSSTFSFELMENFKRFQTESVKWTARHFTVVRLVRTAASGSGLRTCSRRPATCRRVFHPDAVRNSRRQCGTAKVHFLNLTLKWKIISKNNFDGK